MKKIIIPTILLFLSSLFFVNCSSSNEEDVIITDVLVGNWKHTKMIVNSSDVIDDCRKKSFATIDENLNFNANLFRPTATDCRTDVFKDKIIKTGDFNYKIGSEYKIKLLNDKSFELVKGTSNVTDIWEKQ